MFDSFLSLKLMFCCYMWQTLCIFDIRHVNCVKVDYDRNFIVKVQKLFVNTVQNNMSEYSIPLLRNPKKLKYFTEFDINDHVYDHDLSTVANPSDCRCLL